jgi:VTC domain.
MIDRQSRYMELQAKLNRFATVTLEDMSGVKLMNRIDTKYLTSIEKLLRLLEMAHAEYMVQEIDNNSNLPYYTMYLDTDEHRMYVDHLRGKKFRKKIRVRRYESTMLSFLEIKSKNNKGRTKKKRIKCNIDEIEKYRDFISDHSPHNYHSLRRCIENRFNRITLVNRHMTERLTIDSCLRFHNLENGNKVILPDLAIIELKRGSNASSPVAQLLNRLQIRPSGFSKYCIGMALTDPLLRQNRFKPRLKSIARHTDIVKDYSVWPTECLSPITPPDTWPNSNTDKL